MNISSYILEQALRRLQVPETSIRQFAIASSLSDVGGRGFPKELFALSAPVVVRGLLNFAIFQMRRDWVFPFWVHKQLDPNDVAYVARSQNPIFVNTTHRNWTTLGSPAGFHEAIVDPRGMATPLPREWSTEVWLLTDEGVYYPSLEDGASQMFSTIAPTLTTTHTIPGLGLVQEHFVSATRDGLDILFEKIILRNRSDRTRSGTLAVAVRPYNAEGIAPIGHLSTDGKRFLYVNHLLGVVFSTEPARYAFSNSAGGDLASMLRSHCSAPAETLPPQVSPRSISCAEGLAHATALFPFALAPSEATTVHCSIALAKDALLRKRHLKQTWQVSYETRVQRHRQEWISEGERGARIRLGDSAVQQILDANKLSILQLHDGTFISPGPYLYHHFWYRDAVPMCRALDALGFHDRSRKVYDAFHRGQTRDGYYRGPDGEWDANGAVLFGFLEHYRYTRSAMWLRSHVAQLERGASWIVRHRKRTSTFPIPSRGLLPRSLSAEHLGTVDQYYWDTFHGLAGLRAMATMARETRNAALEERYTRESEAFAADIRASLNHVADRLGEQLIPATPTRSFDESAIGSVSGLYPLGIGDLAPEAFERTVVRVHERFVDTRGFLHPFIHSGYNIYLTLHIAQSLRMLGRLDDAWTVGATVLDQCKDPFTFPEAIHPRTGGGAMGDGHHGWAAAEVVLWIRSLIVEETGTALTFFRQANGILGSPPRCDIAGLPTCYGPVDVQLQPDGPLRYDLRVSARIHSDAELSHIEFHLPFAVRRVLPANPAHIIATHRRGGMTILTCRPQVRSIMLECEE